MIVVCMQACACEWCVHMNMNISTKILLYGNFINNCYRLQEEQQTTQQPDSVSNLWDYGE